VPEAFARAASLFQPAVSIRAGALVEPGVDAPTLVVDRAIVVEAESKLARCGAECRGLSAKGQNTGIPIDTTQQIWYQYLYLSKYSRCGHVFDRHSRETLKGGQR
jgi:hypothetical protein